jgi:hypothetical protein
MSITIITAETIEGLTDEQREALAVFVPGDLSKVLLGGNYVDGVHLPPIVDGVVATAEEYEAARATRHEEHLAE